MIALIGSNIQLSKMPAFATHAVCLASLVAAPVDNVDQNQYLHQLDSVTGSMQMTKFKFSLSIQNPFYISGQSLHRAITK